MKKIILILLLCLCPTQAHAITTWKIAPGRSSINFKVNHFIFLEVEGRFKEFKGKVVTPVKDDLTNAQMIAEINSRSIYTGNHMRDADLRKKHFFYAEKFPTIGFKSVAVVKADDGICHKIIGDITIRGVTKRIVLMAKCGKIKTLANGTTRLDLTATGTLNRFDFGLHWNELMETGQAIVGDNVDIIINLALLSE